MVEHHIELFNLMGQSEYQLNIVLGNAIKVWWSHVVEHVLLHASIRKLNHTYPSTYCRNVVVQGFVCESCNFHTRGFVGVY